MLKINKDYIKPDTTWDDIVYLQSKIIEACKIPRRSIDININDNYYVKN